MLCCLWSKYQNVQKQACSDHSWNNRALSKYGPRGSKGYGIVHWRFINLVILSCELLIHPANHSMFWYQIYLKLISFFTVNNYTKQEYWNIDIEVQKYFLIKINISMMLLFNSSVRPPVSSTKKSTLARFRELSVKTTDLAV